MKEKEEPGSPLERRIAARVRDFRTEKGWSLEEMAAMSGVSRSMLSLIERGQTSPTATTLAKIAASLGITLASLFEDPSESWTPVSRLGEQPVWRDPETGYLRRNVSPSGKKRAFRIVEVEFPPQGRVTFDNGDSPMRIEQQIWILEGEMEIRVGSERHRLGKGDCLVMDLHQPISFHNHTRQPARYAVILGEDTGGS